MRERGSKPRQADCARSVPGGRSPCGSVDRNIREACSACSTNVAPRAGAWIETPSGPRIVVPSSCRSPCGSVDRNSAGVADAADEHWSLPVRERGSKPSHRFRLGRKRGVAPRAGAWIETGFAHGCMPIGAGRSPCGSVDRNSRERTSPCPNAGRSPCGSVDRNLRSRFNLTPSQLVAPRAGAWIETAAGAATPRA